MKYSQLCTEINQIFVGSVDLEGKGGKEKSYADFMPIYRKCYDIGKDTVSIYHERGFMSQMWRKSKSIHIHIGTMMKC